MMRLIKTFLIAAAVTGLVREARAFSLLGQVKTWQIVPWGYDLPGDIGTPQLPNEGYRWNVPVIYYAFDYSFITYFGTNGMKAIDQAMAIFNELPRFDRLTNDGSSFYINGEVVPTDSRGPPNHGLNVAGVLDLKSHAMQLVIEELGLAQPTRWIYALGGRLVDNGPPPTTNFTVIKLNFDPITLQAIDSRVNGALYTYDVFDPFSLVPYYADAVERAIDVTNPYGPAVADGAIFAGEYYFGLTHDDVGGLRYLYNRNNLATEQLVTSPSSTVTGGQRFSGGGSPWAAYVGLTNLTLGTNVIGNPNAVGTNLVITGLRPGINRLNFRRARFDSLLGQFIQPITNDYNDLVISNSRPVIQPVLRTLTQPDIIFTCEDLGRVQNLVPVLTARTDTTGWQNNDALNGSDLATGPAFGGPGVITPQVFIRFSDQLPYFSNTNPDFLSGEDFLLGSGVWGSFDENSETPIIYPAFGGLTLEDIQRAARF